MTSSLESEYQMALEQVLGGTHMRMGIFGISDITTEEFHAEIKSWLNWRTVISQLLLYKKASFRNELRAYLFGKHPSTYSDDDIKEIINAFASFGISTYHVEILTKQHVCIKNLSTMEVSNHIITASKCSRNKMEITLIDKAQIYEALKSTELIDLDNISRWLNMSRTNVIKILNRNYILGQDYFVDKYPAQEELPKRHGWHLKNRVRLTVECFRMYCCKTHARVDATKMILAISL